MKDKKRGILRGFADILNPYSWITAARNRLFDNGLIASHSFDIPTICIGNISVGGTGKTPHTEYLIRLLKERFRTAVLSRGYGRNSKGYILADSTATAEKIGDEPFQIKSKFRDIDVAVCEKRVTGIEMITTGLKETEVILLDDAFQHRHVKAGLNIVLIDSNRPIWHDCILPFGRMRESAAGLRRADIAIITKCDGITPKQKQFCIDYIKGIKDIPVFFSHMRYGELYSLCGCSDNRMTTGTEVLLITGIANPQPLKLEIEKQCAKVSMMTYADHHNFTATDFKEIAERYNGMKATEKIIVTTEKDATRIIGNHDTPQIIKDNTFVMPIEVEIPDNKELFNKIILDYVTENSRNR